MAIDTPRIPRPPTFERLCNVRDLGGHTGRAGQVVRWHRLYRADDLGLASRADLDGLAERGVRTVIDLRSPAEVRRRPLHGVPARIEVHHLPLLRDGWSPDEWVRRRDGGATGTPEERIADRYADMLVEGAPAIADALRVMALPHAYPILFHSALGKDRAGVLAAVVLGLLAVHDESIVEDYAASGAALGAARPWVTTRVADDPLLRLELDEGAPPAAMQHLLDRVRARARTMVGYARGIGVPFEVVEALHDNVLA